MIIIEKIKNWRLKRTIPTQLKDRKWRYAENGIDIIPVNEDEEIKKYNYARKREKELKKKHGL